MVNSQGHFAWYELITTDVAGAQAFYTNVIGWDARDASMPGATYMLFTAGDAVVSGMMELPESARNRPRSFRSVFRFRFKGKASERHPQCPPRKGNGALRVPKVGNIAPLGRS